MKFREPLNGATHFLGVIFAIVTFPLLLIPSIQHGKTLHTVSFFIFSLSMLLLYSSSTIYHWANVSKEKIKILRKIDHIMIFVMIAGAYTPIMLITLKGPWGWSLFGVSWGIAFIGLFLKIFWIDMPRKLYVSLYLFMGWLVITALYPLSKALPPSALKLLFAEGVVYSAGAVVYALKKPNFKYLGFHELWHLFSLSGSFIHFLLLYKYIL